MGIGVKKVIRRHESKQEAPRQRRQPCRDWVLRVKKETFDPIVLAEFESEASDLLARLSSHGDASLATKEDERMTVRRMISNELKAPSIDMIRTEEELIKAFYEGVELKSLRNIQDNKHDRALDHSCDINNDYHGVQRIVPIPDVGGGHAAVVRLCILNIFAARKPTGFADKKASKIIFEVDVRGSTTLESMLNLAFEDGLLGHTRDYVVEFPDVIYGDAKTIHEMALSKTKSHQPLATSFDKIPLQIGLQIYIRPQYDRPLGMICSGVTYRSCKEPEKYPVVISTWKRRFQLNVSRCHACMEWFPKVITKNAPGTLSNTYIQWCDECFRAWHKSPVRDGEVTFPPDLITFPYANKAIVKSTMCALETPIPADLGVAAAAPLTNGDATVASEKTKK